LGIFGASIIFYSWFIIDVQWQHLPIYTVSCLGLLIWSMISIFRILQRTIVIRWEYIDILWGYSSCLVVSSFSSKAEHHIFYCSLIWHHNMFKVILVWAAIIYIVLTNRNIILKWYFRHELESIGMRPNHHPLSLFYLLDITMNV
jgi:hypothetical protein